MNWTAAFFATGLIEVKRDGMGIGCVSKSVGGKGWKAHSWLNDRSYQRKRRASAHDAARDMWGNDAAAVVAQAVEKVPGMTDYENRKRGVVKFMNTWEIDMAQRRWRNHPILGPATQTLANLRDAADANSDGWCYWPKPARAARQLMELIESGENATGAQLKKAYAPLKSLQTRAGLQFAIEQPLQSA